MGDSSDTHKYLISGGLVELCSLSPAGTHGKNERLRRESRGLCVQCDWSPGIRTPAHSLH